MKRKKGQLKPSHADISVSAFQEKLQLDFEQKRSKNQALSLRDFARYLDMPVSTLTMLMRGKAKPTRTTLVKLANKLSWLDSEVEQFLKEARRDQNARKVYGKQFQSRPPVGNVLDQLLNLAILSLSRIDNHPASAELIAKKLGVGVADVEESLAVLQAGDFLKIEAGILKSPARIPAFVSDPANQKLIDYKRKFLTHAVDQLKSPASESSNSVLFYFSASPAELENVRNRLGVFMKNLVNSIKPSKDDELYCAAALYFPFKK